MKIDEPSVPVYRDFVSRPDHRRAVFDIDDGRNAVFSRDNGGVGPENPMLDTHLAFQVFEELGQDGPAREALQLAYDLLCQRANHIQEPVYRASFLQNVPVNAAIKADSSRYGLSEGVQTQM